MSDWINVGDMEPGAGMPVIAFLNPNIEVVYWNKEWAEVVGYWQPLPEPPIDWLPGNDSWKERPWTNAEEAK